MHRPATRSGGVRLAIVLPLLVLVAAGCGGGSGDTVTTPQDGVLVRYERRGGLAHSDVVITVREDGSATRTTADGYEYTLTASGRTLRFPQGALPRALVPVIALLDGRAYAA